MNKKKKKRAWRQYIGMVWMILMGAICGVVIVELLEKFSADQMLSESHPLLFIGLLLVGMYIALFFHILVHEAGHLVFGLLTGYTFSSFRIFSFMWLREKGRIRLKKLNIAGTGGQCLMAPPDLKDGRMPVVLYNLGGAFFNVLFAALFLLGYVLCPHMPLLSSLFLIAAVVGLMMALMNGIPMRLGTIDNDGYNVVTLLKNKEAVEAFWVQLKIVEQNSQGVRLKDMPEEWFAFPADEAMKNSMVATRAVFACNKRMDEGNFAQADALMAHLLEIDSGMVGIHHDLLICDRIYVELIGENRHEVIEGMLTKEQQKFMKSMRTFPSVLRTQYALALLWKKDADKAENIQGEFEKMAKSYPYPHEIDSERSLLKLAEEKSKEQ